MTHMVWTFFLTKLPAYIDSNPLLFSSWEMENNYAHKTKLFQFTLPSNPEVVMDTPWGMFIKSVLGCHPHFQYNWES